MDVTPHESPSSIERLNLNSQFMEESFIDQSYKPSKQNPSKSVSDLQRLMQSLDGLLKQANDFNTFLIVKKRKHLQSQEQPESSAKRKRLKPKNSQDDQENSTEDMGTYLTRQPSILKGGKLKEYQLEALNWMITLREANLNGILADDMGLGKTIQSISFLAFLAEFKKIRGPTLIVAPLTTLRNWERELNAWLPSLKSVILFATEKERNATYQQHIKYNNFDVLVTSYQGVVNCFTWLKKISWRTLIIDEAHRIKNDQTQISQTLRHYRSEFKLLMTGTPLSNDLHELWSLLNFILPEIFSDSRIFDNIYKSVEGLKGEEKQRVQMSIAEKIHKVLGPFMKRRTKKEVESGLPPKTEITLYVNLTALQVEMYRNYVRYENPKGYNIWEKYKNRAMQMRKICCHPYMFHGIEPDDLPDPGTKLIEVSGKMMVLDKLLDKLFKEDHKILIFSQFTGMLDILEDYCTFRDYLHCRIDGTMKLDERERHIKRFRTDPDHRIFLISTKAGGLGINLVEADVVIVYDMDWNPQNDLQAIDRAYRIGQTRPVQVFKFICEYSIEERMSEVQKIKLVWDDLVIQKGAIFMNNQPTVNAAQINKMAQLGIGDIFRIEGKVTDEDIDEIIRLGKERDAVKLAEIRKNIQNKINEQMGNRADAQGFNPFNILQQKKYNNDIVNNVNSDNEDENIKLYLKKRNNPQDVSIKPKLRQPKKVIEVPYWHFYPDRNELQEWYAKREEATEKYREEIESKIKKLEERGFPKWTMNEYDEFLEANRKYLKSEYKQIASRVKSKTTKEVQQYSAVYYEKAGNIQEMRKDYKKVLNAQERIAELIRHEKVLRWKRKQYSDTEPLLPLANYMTKNVDMSIARFVIENEQSWNSVPKLIEQLEKDVVLNATLDSNIQDEKYVSKRLNKVLEWIDKEYEEDKITKDIQSSKADDNTKKPQKQSKRKADADSQFSKACRMFIKDKKSKADGVSEKSSKEKAAVDEQTSDREKPDSDDEKKDKKSSPPKEQKKSSKSKSKEKQAETKKPKPKPKKPRSKKEPSPNEK